MTQVFGSHVLDRIIVVHNKKFYAYNHAYSKALNLFTEEQWVKQSGNAMCEQTQSRAINVLTAYDVEKLHEFQTEPNHQYLLYRSSYYSALLPFTG